MGRIDSLEGVIMAGVAVRKETGGRKCDQEDVKKEERWKKGTNTKRGEWGA